MLFGDFVDILSKHFKKSIGKLELCNILFDFVILPADLKDKNGQPLILAESVRSRILKGESPMHNKIRDHIYDSVVIDKLIDNINRSIVPELSPNTDDVIFQIMQIIEKENLSPSHISQFRMLAKEETLSAFLAEVFVYAIVDNSPSNSIRQSSNTSKSNLILRGIKNSKLTEFATIEPFEDLFPTNSSLIITDLTDRINQLNSIHLSFDNTKALPMFSAEYKFDKEKEKCIKGIAESLSINLCDDFFMLGNMTTSALHNMYSSLNGTTPVRGTDEETNKLALLNQLYEKIVKASRIIPFLDAFSECKCISLAVENIGTSFDNKVRIRIEFPKGALLNVDDIMNEDDDAIEWFYSKGSDLLYIKQGVDYLDYPQSEDLKFHAGRVIRLDDHSITQDDISDLLEYHFAEDDDVSIIELSIDNINQHTAVAFPMRILLKNDQFTNINYTIRSKYTDNVYSGSIVVRKDE